MKMLADPVVRTVSPEWARTEDMLFMPTMRLVMQMETDSKGRKGIKEGINEICSIVEQYHQYELSFEARA